MAIQFPCGSCGQPIEIDDEWGGKTVACPFCHSRIVAPVESQLSDSEFVPTASPAPPRVPDALSSAPPPTDRPAVAMAESNRLAVVAVILAAVMLFTLIAMKWVIGNHIGEIEALGERWQALVAEGKGFMLAWQTVQMELLEANNGTIPTWLMVVGVLEVVAAMTWLAALVCGILAVRKPWHRRYAVASLVVCGISPVIFCCCGSF